MKILIATGIYPPQLGGPAQYALHLKETWQKMGHSVVVKTYHFEHRLPPIIRHFYYLFKIISAVITSDFIFALDTFSVGVPATIAARIFGKKIIMRTGGDFLWEGYVERTGDYVLFKDFYLTTMEKWSKKEKIIFKITKWTLQHVGILFFSTTWQRDIWTKAYDLDLEKIKVIENYYGAKEKSYEPVKKDFIAGVRELNWKNVKILKDVFSSSDVMSAGALYDRETCPHDEFMDKIAHGYATILVSLGDISPNMVLDSIRHDKPFILTQENGLMDRINPIAITVDPMNANDIKEKVLWLCVKENYDSHVEKMKKFTFTHTWEQIAGEIIDIYKKI